MASNVVVGPPEDGRGRGGHRGHGGFGGWGGGNLSAQISAMGTGFDPSAMMNYMVNLRTALAARQRQQILNDQQNARNRAFYTSGVQGNRFNTPVQSDPFQTNLRDLNYLQSKDPWAGGGFGQVTGRQFFNFPAAAALTYGRDIFPNGFDAYANLAQAGRGMNPGLQAQFGSSPWGQGY